MERPKDPRRGGDGRPRKDRLVCGRGGRDGLSVQPPRPGGTSGPEDKQERRRAPGPTLCPLCAPRLEHLLLPTADPQQGLPALRLSPVRDRLPVHGSDLSVDLSHKPRRGDPVYPLIPDTPYAPKPPSGRSTPSGPNRTPRGPAPNVPRGRRGPEWEEGTRVRGVPEGPWGPRSPPQQEVGAPAASRLGGVSVNAGPSSGLRLAAMGPLTALVALDEK